MKPEMRRKRFTQGEAEHMRGRRVRSVVEFTDIPKGTTGRVIGADEIEPGDFEILVEWELPGRHQRQHDWFTREDFEHSLIEV